MDPLDSAQYYLHNTGQIGGAPDIDINAAEAWVTTRGSATIRVAVIDQGVENHEDYNGRVVAGYTAGIPTGNGAPTTVVPASPKAHGEACAGIIAATHDNNVGIKGVTTNVSIVPVNIFPLPPSTNNEDGAVSNAEIATAIDWAWNQGAADILSNSWSGNPAAPSSAISDAINRAMTNGRGGRGCPVIFSSGNFYPSISDVGFPSNQPNVIAVGACSNVLPAGGIWGYSQRGSSMDVVAPSGDGFGVSDITTTDRMGTSGYNNGNYTDFNGTSAACPQVSGVAALILSVNPALTEAQVRSIIQTTATDMGAAGFDNTFGYGRINASAAVCKAFETLTIPGPELQCNPSQVYTLPTTANLTWSPGGTNGIASIAPNGNSVTLSRIGSGSGNIFLYANPAGCPSSQYVVRTIGVGAAPPTNITGFLDLTGFATPKIQITNVSTSPGQSVSQYIWTVNGISAGTTYDQFPHLDLNGQNYCNYSYFLVGLKLNTSCGISPEGQGVVNSLTTGCSPFAFVLSPNPSTSYVSIDMDYNTMGNSKNINTVEMLDIILYDQQQNIVKREKMANGTKQYRLNTSDLKTGMYYIRITDTKNTVTKPLSIVTN